MPAGSAGGQENKADVGEDGAGTAGDRNGASDAEWRQTGRQEGADLLMALAHSAAALGTSWGKNVTDCLAAFQNGPDSISDRSIFIVTCCTAGLPSPTDV